MRSPFRALAVLVTVLLLGCCMPCGVRAANCAETANAILTAQMEQSGAVSVQQWLDEPLSAAVGSGGTDWYIMALSHSDTHYDFTACEAALRNIIAQGSGNAVSRQRTALTYLAVAPETVNSLRTLLDETIGQQGLMSWVYGLHLQNNGVPCAKSSEETIAQILSMQLADGGWTVTGSNADVDVTAMTLQALAAHREDATVAAAIEKAVDYLSTAQLENGGFQSYGTPNPESIAQVWIALSLLDIDALTDARFIKYCDLYQSIQEFSVSPGAFAHTVGGQTNNIATVQVYLALVAYDMFQSGKSSFFHFADAIPLPVESTVTQLTAATTTTSTTVAATTSETSSQESSAAETTSPTEPTTTTTVTSRQAFVWKPTPYLLKWVLTAAILVAAAIAVLVLMKRGRRHFFHYIAVGLIAALLIGAVHLIRVESPQEHYQNAGTPPNAVGSITFSICCDLLPTENQHPALPDDGNILAPTVLYFEQDATVLDALQQACTLHQLQVEIDGSDTLAYVRGIANLYEFDYGELSGWMFLVNGETASVGCGQVPLADGDRVQWIYTLDLGRDIVP
ncbi:MAG: DUF4430 domain-containing protein [Oscillospiraceae bacterium]